MLEIKNYSNFILKDINFCLKESENLLILGENGAGKSTLAKVLTALISSNSLFINKENISKISNLKRAKLLNYIPSNFDIFDEYMSVLEYIKISSIEEKRDEQIEEVIKTLRLENIKNQFCIDLSSGEKQLLLLVSAILHGAKITIFDELTANLDIKRLKEVFSILNSNLINQKIIITHNLDLAYALKYKVLFLQNGKIEFFGEHKEFFTKENLEKFYNSSIKLENNHLVVDL